jgi:hypothetical protein
MRKLQIIPVFVLTIYVLKCKSLKNEYRNCPLCRRIQVLVGQAFLLSTLSRLALWPTHPPSQWILGAGGKAMYITDDTRR